MSATERPCLICGHLIVRGASWDTAWKRFCSRSCAGKYAARRLAASASSAQRSAWGKEGSRAKNVRIHEDVTERFEKYGREGYWLAYCAGRHAKKTAGQRARKAQRAA